MRSRLAALVRALRFAALALLVCGLVTKPLLEQLGDAHAAEHALLAAADHGHEHGHPDHDPGEDPAHAEGLHGLMHQAECGSAAALWPSFAVALHAMPTAAPAQPDAASPRARIPTSPFRPPIA